MKRVRISFSTKIYYDQFHDVTEEEYEILKAYDGENIPDAIKNENENCKIKYQTCPAHETIKDLIDDEYVLFENEFESFEIEEEE